MAYFPGLIVLDIKVFILEHNSIRDDWDYSGINPETLC